jgi:hypothetical protein
MQVRISKPARSTMQSADGNGSWLLEFVKKPEKRFKEPVMGRTSSSDMSNELKLYFNSAEEAIAFAEKKTYQYEIIAPKEPKLPKKSYSDNFK